MGKSQLARNSSEVNAESKVESQGSDSPMKMKYTHIRGWNTAEWLVPTAVPVHPVTPVQKELDSNGSFLGAPAESDSDGEIDWGSPRLQAEFGPP